MRVALDIQSGERLQAAPVSDVDANREQILNVLGNPDIFEKPDRRLGVQLDQNIDIAPAGALPAREGAEQRRVTNPASAQFAW
jgi:hypothetical protein